MNNALVKLLAFLVVAGAAAWWFGSDYYKDNVQQPTLKAQAELEKINNEIAAFEKAAEQVPNDIATLQRYNSRSLPADLSGAQSLYRTWLIELADFSGVEESVVEAGRPVPQGNFYYTMSFSVTGRCTLDQLTRFLFEFYAAPHLHRIQSIQLTPLRDKERSVVRASITIDTIILPTADRRDRLAAGTLRRLTSVQLPAYAPIAERDFLAIRHIRTKADPADFAVISAVTKINDRPEVWVTIRTERSESERILKVREGDLVEVGSFSGVVVVIDDPDMIVDVDGQRWLLSMGDALTDGFPLPPEF